MPEMDGFTFLEKIKSDPVLVNLPVIVISAEEDMDGIVRCLEMGATDYLNKPYEPAILKARLNASLSTKRFHDKEKAYIRTIQSSQMAVSLENVKLHESVHSQREQYEALIDNIPVGICRIKVSIKTGESQFIQVNPALGKMFGYDSIEELLDKNVSEMYASQKEKHLFIQILSEKGHCKNVELQFKRKDNSFVVVSCNAKAKFNRDKDVLMIDGVIEDVTEKKKAEADRANFVQELCTINEAYERFVPSEFLDLLQKGKITDVVLGDHIQQEMHIMFSDIRSFTTLSETMTPKENFQFINAYLNKISRKIRENKGFIDKFIGDGIMALFPENASDAIDAGIAMLGALRQYNEQRKTKNRTPIRIGIGIHTGSVILGTVGDRDRMEGTVISDSVNLASRIEGLTKKYSTSILVSEQTFMKVPDERKYAYRILGNTNVKGKVDPVVIIEILNGNSQEIIDLKLSTKMDFEFGIILYQSGDYKNAKEAFQKVLSKNPNDKTAEAYLNNSKYFEIHGAPSEWEKTDMMEKNI
jgi:PAS domain S-box-containing protein